MTLQKTLRKAVAELNSFKIADAHFEARILLGHVLKISAVEIYTKPDSNLSAESAELFSRLLQRRIEGEPTAYILNFKEFFGIDFFVDQRVLIPRPETELLVEETLKFFQEKTNNMSHCREQPLIAEVGTGCGNIAISLALNNEYLNIFAVDSSIKALEVARLNCQRHRIGNRITFLHGKYLEAITCPVDIVVANLPYIRKSELPKLQSEILHFEPTLALDGGATGLDHITQLLAQIKERPIKPYGILLEIGAGQELSVSSLITALLPNCEFEFVSDLNGIKRVVKIDVKTPTLSVS
jgi:release factor glutamine methyltransferase